MKKDHLVLNRSFKRFYIWACICLSFQLIYAEDNSSKWIGTWSCAPYAAGNNTPPSPYLANNTLRQIVRASIGGDTIRVKFSNRTSSTPVTIKAVNIAVSNQVGGSSIDASTIKQLKFNGSESVTMNAYSEVTSDSLAFAVKPGMHLAISIHYGQCQIASDMTHHYGSRCDSYILEGDQTQNETFSGATVIERWYTINTIDVLAPEESGAVAVLGNSITDGYGLHGGLKNKWTDKFSEKLLTNEATSNVSVLNMGIGATWLTSSGVNRYQQDILAQNGLRWIIIFYGVNDIGGGASADAIISAYKQMIAKAHAANIRIYGGTITPFKGHGYYTVAHEAVRTEVNEWIRTSGEFDQVIDFDAFVRDPNDHEKLIDAYSNDWLHPNAEGYKKLGESIDLNLFLGQDTVYEQPDYETYYLEPECENHGSNWEVVEDLQVSYKYVTVKNGVQSIDVASENENDQISFNFNVEAEGFYTVYARVNCPTANDDSFWLKMNEGWFEMKNGLYTSGWKWVSLGQYQLSAGANQLFITYREDGAQLDKIAVSNALYPPDGLGEDALNACNVTSIQRVKAPEKDIYGVRNYPNPFSMSTNIVFNLDKQEDVSLKIFNDIGQEVNTLVCEKLPAGKHSFSWRGINSVGTKQVNGIYFYKLKIDINNFSGKMQLQ